MKSIISLVINLMLIALTIFGLYKLITNDKYSTTDAYLGVIIFPYSTWIGIKETVYKIRTTVPSELIEFENECQSELKEYGYERSERYRECRNLRIEMQKGKIELLDKRKILKFYEQRGIS